MITASQLVVAALAGLVALAQDAPGPAPAASSRRDAAAAPLAAGRRALAEGKRAEAATHLQRALAASPSSAASPTSLETLALLVEACAEDPDARTLWLHALFATAAGPHGSSGGSSAGAIALDADLRKKLPAEDPLPEKLAAARAAAVEELVKLARAKEREAAQQVDALLVAQWARRAAADLARDCPRLLAEHGDELSPRLAIPGGLPEKVVKLLESFAVNSLANGRIADAINASRILAGLATEIAFGKDLQGEKPSNLSGLGERAASLLAKARAQLAGRSDKPWTVDELLQLDGEQEEAFTREHSSFANPGVALSPQGWYRIETDCGFNTLLGAAQTLEQHHARLAGWYGEDPFVGRPGLVRIVPEAAGLEAENVPFWWAGGFQAGDVTTVRFSCGTIEGLGHLLTHELTHRFDGAIFPGIPAWLAEGKAVWTGGAYGRASDATFVERWASIGTIEGAFIKGYGDKNSLVKLIEGTIDDYRDNYVAGFALYVYLNTRKSPAGAVLFKDRLQKFMKDARGTRKWTPAFAACFCDGKEGRPKDLDGFVADWAPWIAGFYWQNRKPWVNEYTQDVKGVDSKLVMDEPTWVWTRHRAEPRFGQDQAANAGNLLLAAGRRADAIPALVWALAVDGRRPREEARLAAALAAENRRESAWALKQTVEFPYGERAGRPPFAGAVGKALALVELLDAAAADAAARKLPITAAALRADRERAASWLGVERKDAGAAAPAPVAIDAGKALHSFDPPSRPLAAGGFIESGLTDYEERRAKGRWYVDDDGDLHVGRDKPRSASGIVDRAAAQLDCFALAPDWILPGTWRFDARIRFTTSFLNAAVIFGYAERESNLRFGISAGDFLYATGVSNKEPEFTGMGWSLGGLRDRDGLPYATSGGSFDFGATSSSFELSLLVDGAFVQAFINGRRVGQYHAVDGAAIEGRIGFATSMGAIEVEQPRVTRLERSRLAPSAAFAPTCFDLFSSRSLPPWESHHRSCVGLPKATQGTLVLWIAPYVEPAEAPAAEVQRAGFLDRSKWDVRELAAFVERAQPTQRLVVAVPAQVGESGRAYVTEYVAKILGDRAEVLLHAQPFVPDGVIAPKSRRWLLFVDSSGIVRALSELPNAVLTHADHNFMQWLTVFRDHGQPMRDLPPVERPSAR